MKRAIVGVLVISLLLLLKSCNTTEPPPPPNDEKPTLELKLEDVSCTEAWIELTTTNLQLPATITLKQFNPTGDTLSHISILKTHYSMLTCFSQTKHILFIQPYNHPAIQTR